LKRAEDEKKNAENRKRAADEEFQRSSTLTKGKGGKAPPAKKEPEKPKSNKSIREPGERPRTGTS